ncbi:alanine racemase [Vaginisenegalia massiliensis]|uniref:alanine racemase n=1 Tax=Vaginisenegalia massiliensis TaxID=2058294 RepID=UPI000F54C069|nr:alanine racemase [Vaginisenegalia massiliensis]
MIEPSEHRPTQAIVDLNAIQHNVKQVLATMQPNQVLYATVKANGYGHGAEQVARAAMEAGAQGLCVASVDEAIELRKSGLIQVPILVLGLTDPRGIAEILHYHITITVSSADFFVEAYQQLADTDQLSLLSLYQLPFHLALDTGMSRIGLTSVAEIEAFKATVASYDWIDWQGAFTHFSTAGGGDPTYIDYQWEKWLELTAVLPEEVSLRHFANSAMGMWYPKQPQSDIVRLGISMYGLDPKDQIPSPGFDLKPALQLISEIVYVKQVPKGTKISYGATYEASQDEWIATIPMGYADGWFRRYKAVDVLIDGQACPVVGIINMDQMMVKLPKAYPVGTLVTFIGDDGGLTNHVSDLARKLDTISYEILCGIGPRVPRIYLKD